MSSIIFWRNGVMVSSLGGKVMVAMEDTVPAPKNKKAASIEATLRLLFYSTAKRFSSTIILCGKHHF
jgi:hypothetical protein